MSFLALMLCGLVPSVVSTPRSPQDTRSRFEVPPEGTSVPMHSWDGRPVVEAQCGDRTLRLIVDTGSTSVLVLGREVGDVDELRLGEARLANPPVRRIDFPLSPPGTTERIDGILGIHAFAGSLIVFDFGTRRFELAHGALSEDDPDTIGFFSDGGMDGIPTVSLRAGGVALEAHLDTGSPELLLVPSELAERLPQKGVPQVLGVARTPMGDAEIRQVELDGAIELGPLRHEHALLRIADLPQIAGRGLGNVGARLFGDARLTLDLASQRMHIETNEPRRRAVESRTSGTAEPELEDLLARMSGDFDVRARMVFGEEFRELAGRATWSPAHVGRFTRESFVLDDPDRGSLEGMAFVGPTAVPGHYELVQLDGFHPSALHVWGSWDATRRALVLETVVPRDAPAGLAPPRVRWTYRALEGGGFEKAMLRIDEDGSARLASTYRYLPRS